MGLLFLWPLLIFIGIAVKLSSKGSVFFIQKRIGQYAKEFNCIKFRTMYIGSDKFGSITASSDSRITPVGKILRKFKLDELPQLWNVFTGKMSFVGPRPDVPGYADKLEGDNLKILQLPPGITGPASIYFRNEEQILAGVNDPKKFNDTVIWPQKIIINKNYVENWSLINDVGFILITIFPALDRWFRLIESHVDLANMNQNEGY